MLNRTNNTQHVARSERSTSVNFSNFRHSTSRRRTDASKISHAEELPPPGESVKNRILTSALFHASDNVLPHLETVALSAGDELYAAGENNKYVYFPETAVISHLYNLADGNTIETAMVGDDGASGLCGLFGARTASHHALVIIEGKARRVKTEILRQEFARCGKLQTLLLDYVAAHLAQVSQKVVCTSFHLMEKRLCCWLLMLHDRVGGNQLNITHEQISRLLGVNRPGISVSAKTLRDKGLINYVRGKFYILDRFGLEATSCECYSAVQNF